VVLEGVGADGGGGGAEQELRRRVWAAMAALRRGLGGAARLGRFSGRIGSCLEGQFWRRKAGEGTCDISEKFTN